MQKIMTPGGETFILLPVAEYEALLDAADFAAHSREMEKLAKGETELLTPEETMAFIEAPTPLAFWRKKRGRRQIELARAIGISQSYLADIEAGRRIGDPVHYKRLAAELSVVLEALIEDGKSTSRPVAKGGKPLLRKAASRKKPTTRDVARKRD